MKFLTRYLASVLLCALTLSLYGCGGSSSDDSDDSNDTQKMLVWPALGQVLNPTIRLSRSDNTQIEITTTFNDDGSILVSFSADITGPIIIEIIGNNRATYFDEASGTFQPFGPGEIIRHVLASPTGEVGVSALNEFAALLLDNVPSLNKSFISQANELIRAALAPSMNSILIAPQTIGSQGDLDALENNVAGEYAAILGALAKLHNAPKDLSPVLEIIRQLGQDIMDGVINGLDADGAPIDGLSYDAANFVNDFTAAVNAIGVGTPLEGHDFMTVNANVGDLDGDNEPPTADAGPNQTVNEGDTVDLDGTQSADSDGTVEDYSWTQTDSSGINIPLVDATTATPSFVAPDVSVDTVFTFALVVSDDDSEESVADSVEITVADMPAGGGFTLSGTIENPNAVPGQWELRVDGIWVNDGQFLIVPVIYNMFDPVSSGSTYEVTVNAPCSVDNGSGTVTNADITNIDITCP